MHPYARGSLQRIEASRSSSVTWGQLDGIFLQDRFAKSSLAPRTSRWRTWCKLAALRNTSALPITVNLALKIGALLKQGRYRSSAQYFGVAKQFHVEAGNVWDQALDQAVAQAVRSIERGQGPSQPKLPLHVQNLTLSSADVLSTRLAQISSGAAQLAEPFGTLLGATWFLLRGLEVASALCL